MGHTDTGNEWDVSITKSQDSIKEFSGLRMWNFSRLPWDVVSVREIWDATEPTVIAQAVFPRCITHFYFCFYFLFLLFYPTSLCRASSCHTPSSHTFQITFWHLLWLASSNCLFEARMTWNIFDWWVNPVTIQDVTFGSGFFNQYNSWDFIPNELYLIK